MTTENHNGFNDKWELRDMVAFNRNLIDEKEVSCQWMNNGSPCNDPVKGKEFKDHLHHKHGVTSDSQSYQCRWDACFGQPMKKSSLERHVVEQHVPVKWACPYCVETCTRECTLLAHIKRSHGHT